MFQGAITAMVSPFSGGQLDETRLRANVDFQIDHNIDGLVPVGTTGESPTLDHDEHNRVIDIVVEQAAGRVPVIAGAGSNSTAEALALANHAKQSGASATLQVNPYYNKPTQEGLYRHFMTVADHVDLPIVLYNIPGRCSVALSVDTIVRLARHDNIVAIKEATGSLDVASQISAACDLVILSGDDALTLPLMSIGGRGVISVTSNILPDRMVEMTGHALANRWAEARSVHLELIDLFKGLFIETNPIPVKAAMALMGIDSGEVRLPLCEMTKPHTAQLTDLLKRYNLI